MCLVIFVSGLHTFLDICLWDYLGARNEKAFFKGGSLFVSAMQLRDVAAKIPANSILGSTQYGSGMLTHRKTPCLFIFRQAIFHLCTVPDR